MYLISEVTSSCIRSSFDRRSLTSAFELFVRKENEFFIGRTYNKSNKRLLECCQG